MKTMEQIRLERKSRDMARILPYGYKTFTGRVMNNYDVDRYNALTRTIERFKKDGIPVREVDLNDRHAVLVSASLHGRPD